MSRRVQGFVSDEAGEEFARYLTDHEISEGEAVRIAVARLLRAQPTKAERAAAIMPRGNPNLRDEARK